MKELFVMKKLLLPGFVLVLALALAGCCSGDKVPEKQNAELEKRIAVLEMQNEQILSQLRRIDLRLPPVDSRYLPYQPSPSDARFLKIKPLPPNPGDEQIAAYVRAIAGAFAGGHVSSLELPVRLLRKIGPGHLKALLPVLKSRNTRGAFRVCLGEALPFLVTPQDTPFIKANLPETPMLFHAVTSVEAARAMKREIFWVLRSAMPVPPRLQAIIPRLVETPGDLKTLEDIYCTNPAGAHLTPIFVAIPGCDLKRLTVRAWKAQDPRRASAALLQWAIPAVRYGHDVDACKYLLKSLIPSRRTASEISVYRLAEAQKLLGNLSDFPVQDRARLADWYAKNQARIVFDEKSGKFTLKK